MRTDFAIVGGGIVGLAIARKLARTGGRVVLYESGEPGMQASWAAAGMLAPQAEAEGPGAFLSLLLKARDEYTLVVRSLEEETGIDVGYRSDGMLVLALDDADEEDLAKRFRWQSKAGLAVDHLTSAEARSLEAALSPLIRSALRFPDDHQVDNRLLTRAFRSSAMAAGVGIRAGVTVRAIEPVSGGVRLWTGDEAVDEAGVVVLAAGSWSGLLDGLPSRLPVEPVHGQLFALEMGSPELRHTVSGAEGYMVPRADGRLIVGATVERIGYRAAVTTAGMMQLTSAALRMAPGLGDRPIVAQWSGFRPGTPDGLPILGRDPQVPQLLYATGHYRNGILLAPLTGELIGSLALGIAPAVDLTPYRIDRFLAG